MPGIEKNPREMLLNNFNRLSKIRSIVRQRTLLIVYLQYTPTCVRVLHTGVNEWYVTGVLLNSETRTKNVWKNLFESIY